MFIDFVEIHLSGITKLSLKNKSQFGSILHYSLNETLLK